MPEKLEEGNVEIPGGILRDYWEKIALVVRV